VCQHEPICFPAFHYRKANNMHDLPSLGGCLITAALALSTALPALAESAGARQDEVARRGAQAMPFDLEKTRHLFTETGDGGIQQVIAKEAADREQIALIRRHLQDIAGEFGRGDFSGPAGIHGGQMPGLARLRQAKPGDWKIEYRDLPNGAKIRYASTLPEIVQAIHDWFGAQLSDHGRHVMPGL
jgi:hypothetical protein